MKPLTPTRRRHGGFTLVELMAAMAIGSIIMAGVGVTSITLQRSFVAADYQMTSQNDQLRVLDYISRDLHSASALTILNSGTKISLTLSATSPGLINLSLAPPLNLLLGPTASASSTITVAYYVEGGQLIRDVNGAQTVLASTVDDLEFTQQNPFVTTSIMFTPQFSLDPSTSAQQCTRVTSSTYLMNMASAN